VKNPEFQPQYQIRERQRERERERERERDRKEDEEEEKEEETTINWAQWLIPVIPGIWVAEIGRSQFEVSSSTKLTRFQIPFQQKSWGCWSVPVTPAT
jgi:hypothetical protein